MVHLRTGPSRTKQDFDDVSQQIVKTWEDVVGARDTKKLGSVFLVGGLVSTFESDVVLPPAGEEPEWIRQNFGKFQEMAKHDEKFRDFVEELQTRECFKTFVPT